MVDGSKALAFDLGWVLITDSIRALEGSEAVAQKPYDPRTKCTDTRETATRHATPSVLAFDVSAFPVLLREP